VRCFRPPCAGSPQAHIAHSAYAGSERIRHRSHSLHSANSPYLVCMLRIFPEQR
jgi:hypothetical protein